MLREEPSQDHRGVHVEAVAERNGHYRSPLGEAGDNDSRPAALEPGNGVLQPVDRPTKVARIGAARTTLEPRPDPVAVAGGTGRDDLPPGRGEASAPGPRIGRLATVSVQGHQHAAAAVEVAHGDTLPPPVS